jgi:hypothetical protein
MKYLKKYKIFTEEAEFDVNITDEPDLKMAKEKLATLKSNLSEYNTKKNLIDSAYLTIKLDDDLKKKIEEIVGKEDTQPGKDRNPFLVGYLHVASLKRRVNKLQDQIANDKLSKDDFNEELGLSTEDSTKASISSKITDINNRISEKNVDLASLSKEIIDSEKELQTKMSSVEKEMQDYIKKISSEVQK